MGKKIKLGSAPPIVPPDSPLVEDPSLYREIDPSEILQEEEEKGFYKEWIEYRPNEFIPTPSLIIKKCIPAGCYNIKWDYQNNWPIFIKRQVKLDELLMLPDPIFTSILGDINYFWNNKPKFVEYKYAYKRGILLYGPPGSGKTSLVALLSEDVIQRGGIVLNIKEVIDLQFYVDSIGKIFRHIQPDTPILTVMEDIDGFASVREAESMLLNVLDGSYQLANVVYLACTNYPEKLEARILNRPSRFDKRYLIGLPNSEVRKFYLQRKISASDLVTIDLEDIVEKTEGLSLAHLGEFVKSVFIFGKTVEEAVDTLKDMSTIISSSKFTTRKSTGFN